MFTCLQRVWKGNLSHNFHNVCWTIKKKLTTVTLWSISPDKIWYSFECLWIEQRRCQTVSITIVVLLLLPCGIFYFYVYIGFYRSISKLICLKKKNGTTLQNRLLWSLYEVNKCVFILWSPLIVAVHSAYIYKLVKNSSHSYCKQQNGEKAIKSKKIDSSPNIPTHTNLLFIFKFDMACHVISWQLKLDFSQMLRFWVQ